MLCDKLKSIQRIQGICRMFSRFWLSVGLLLTAGCSQLTPAVQPRPAATLEYVSAAASADLAAASAGQRLRLAESPWGPGAELLIQKRYFAASGRVCLEVEVQQQSALLCDFQQAGWAAQRLLTRQDQ